MPRNPSTPPSAPTRRPAWWPLRVWTIWLGIAAAGLTAAAELAGGEITWGRAGLWAAAAVAASAGVIVQARSQQPAGEAGQGTLDAQPEAADRSAAGLRVQQGTMRHYGTGDQYQVAGDLHIGVPPPSPPRSGAVRPDPPEE